MYLNIKGMRLLMTTLLVLCSSGLLAQSLVYEREFTLIAEDDNTLRMELTAAGILTVHRPAFMTEPGRHELSVSQAIYLQLADQLAARAEDSRHLSSDIQQRATAEMRYISDPEISRFYRLDEQDRKTDSVSAVSLEAWAGTYPDDGQLARLSELEQQWYQLMQGAMEEDQ